MVFRQAVLDALHLALGDDAKALGDLGALLTRPPKVEMGDLAFPCFPLAKSRRMAPPKIAAELAGSMAPSGLIAKIEAAGPYVNFHADATALLQGLQDGLADGSYFDALRADAPQRVMIEFSQPNTHKVFHVGHLRNVALGDALVRIFRARGHDVVAANYYGDFGIDVAKCLWWLRGHPQEEPPERGRIAWLGKAYTAATLKLAEAKERDREAFDRLNAGVREVLRGMEEGEPEITALYRETRQWCLDEFAAIYAELGVAFDHDFFESEVEEAGNRVVDEYLAKGVFKESQGAIVSDLEGEGLGVSLVRKSDGASLYMTWDLALAREKFDRFHIEKSIYVVDAGQSLHFQQLFATLRRMGYRRADDCRHVAYELVMLPEGKMSSRKGTAIPLSELGDTVRAAIEAKMRAEDRAERAAWTDAQWESIAQKVVKACLKYGMLSVGNTRTVTFDIDAWTNPEGDTGAYVLYSLARIAGIHRKAAAAGAGEATVSTGCGFGNAAERELVGHLLRFGEVVARAEETCDPSGLAAWLFDAAKGFSRFYQECPVLQAEPALRATRLVLVACTETIVRRALDLVGIEPVEAM